MVVTSPTKGQKTLPFIVVQKKRYLCTDKKVANGIKMSIEGYGNKKRYFECSVQRKRQRV